MGATIVLIGLGHLGGPLLDRLAVSAAVGRVVGVSRDPDRGAARCNLARLSAAAVGVRAHIEHRPADVSHPEQVAGIVEELSPDLVIHTASLQTWWLLDLFPPAAEALKAVGFGVWLPLHLTLALRVMEGLAAVGYKGHVINAVYPDVINVVLGKLGMAPTVGVGNVDELVTKVRMVVARDLAIGPHDLDVRLVAHHALQRAAFRGAKGRPSANMAAVGRRSDEELPPYYLWVGQKGRDLTEQADARGALLGPCPLPGGPGWGGFTAASAAGLVGALLSDRTWRMHAPGPAGLPGGYPIDVGGGKIVVSEIPDLSLDEAISINERSHRFDGIETIEEDGSVVFTEESAAVMRDALGYEGKTLRPAEAADRAAELSKRFNEYARQHGVDLALFAG